MTPDLNDQDDYALAGLRARYPQALCWHGQATGRWWAMLPAWAWPALVEAASSVELGQQLRELLPQTGVAGRWTPPSPVGGMPRPAMPPIPHAREAWR